MKKISILKRKIIRNYNNRDIMATVFVNGDTIKTK